MWNLIETRLWLLVIPVRVDSCNVQHNSSVFSNLDKCSPIHSTQVKYEEDNFIVSDGNKCIRDTEIIFNLDWRNFIYYFWLLLFVHSLFLFFVLCL